MLVVEQARPHVHRRRDADRRPGVVGGGRRDAIRDAREHGVPGVGHEVDHDLTQAIGVGRPGDAFGRFDDHVGRPRLAGHHRLRRVADQAIDLHRVVGQRDRLGVVEDVVDDAVEPGDLALDVGGDAGDLVRRGDAAAQRSHRPLDDHQRVADLVRDDRRQAAERRQPLALRRLALEAIERDRQRMEGAGQEPRVLVVPRRRRRRLGRRGQDAGGGHLAHRRGERADRPRHRAGDREAEERRDQHRHRGRRAQRRVQVAQEGQVRGARAGDDGQRPAGVRRGRRSAASPASRAPARRRTASYSSPFDHRAQHAAVVGHRQQRRRDVGGQRRAARLAAVDEHDVAAGDRLDAIRQRPIEAQAGGQRAEHLGLRRIDEDRHRHDLQQAAPLRPDVDRRSPGQCRLDDPLRRRRPSGGTPGSPITDSTLPLRLVTTNRSAWTASRYSVGERRHGGPCFVSTAAFSSRQVGDDARLAQRAR